MAKVVAEIKLVVEGEYDEVYGRADAKDKLGFDLEAAGITKQALSDSVALDVIEFDIRVRHDSVFDVRPPKTRGRKPKKKPVEEPTDPQLDAAIDGMFDEDTA